MLRTIELKSHLISAVEESQKLVHVTRRSLDSSLIMIHKLNVILSYLHNPNIRAYLIFSWWTLCLRFHVLIWFLPLVLGSLLCFFTQKSPKEEKPLYHMIDGKVVYNTVNVVSELNAMRSWLIERIPKTEDMMLVTPIHIFTTVFMILPVWWTLLYLVSFSKLLAMGGTLVILETSTLHQTLRKQLFQYLKWYMNDKELLPVLYWQNLTSPRVVFFKEPLDNNKSTPCFTSIENLEQDSLKYFLKSTYNAVACTSPKFQYQTKKQLAENQCYSLFYGWQPTHLDTDPSPWTLEGNPSLSKYFLELPPPTVKSINARELGLLEDKHIRMCQYWVWDDDWMLLYNSLTDDEGWSYGDSHWKNLNSRYRRGLFTAKTRQRHWQRRATLYCVYIQS